MRQKGFPTAAPIAEKRSRKAEGKRQNLLLVNDHHHTVLAVLALGAVQPHGGGALDLDGEDGDLALGGGGGDGLVSGVDALGGGVDVLDGDARVVEGGLDNGVVAAAELELDHGADGGVDLVGEELEGVVGRGDGDDLDVDGWVSC